MNTFGIPKKNPTGGNEKITKKVSEVKETVLSAEQKEKYKDVVLTLKQIEELKQGKLTEARLSILALEQLKIETKPYSGETLKARLNKGIESAKESSEKAEDVLSDAMDTVSENKAVKAAGTTAKKAIKKGKEAAKGFSMMKLINKWENSGNWFLEIIAGILSMIAGIFGFDKLKEKAKNKLSSEEVKETKNKLKSVSDAFIESFNSKSKIPILPETKTKLEKLFEKPGFFTDEQIAVISKQMKDGTFKFSNLGSIIADKDKLKEINTILFSPEQKELLRDDFANKASAAVAEEFHIDLKKLDKTKQEKLRALFTKTGINEDFIELAEKYETGAFISYGEIFGGFMSTVYKAPLFAFELIRIIPFVNIAENLTAGASALLEAASGNATEENIILKKLEGLNPDQKNMVLGIMLRKGMFVFNLIDKLTFSLTRTISETIIGGKTISSTEGVKAVLLNDYKKQSKIIDRLVGTLGGIQNEALGNILKQNISNLLDASKEAKHVSNIMQIIKDTEKAGGNIREVLKNNPDIKALNIDLSSGEVKKLLGEKINSFGEKIGIGTKDANIIKYLRENKLGFSKQSDLFREIEIQGQKIKTLGSEWNRRLGNGTLGKVTLDKFHALGESVRFNQTTRNIEIHANSLQEGLEEVKKLEKFKAMAAKSPALLGSMAGTAGIVLSIKTIGNLNENKLENTLSTLQYLIPTYGPLKVLLSDSGIQNMGTNSLRDNLITTGEAAPMIMFLGMDLAYVSSQLVGNKFGTALKNIGKYHIQVFKTPYDLAVSLKNFSQTTSEMIKAPGSININIKNGFTKLTERATKALSKMKGVIKTKPGKIALVLVVLSGYASSQIMDSTTEELREEYEKNGFLKKDGNFDLEKIKSSMSDEEKEFLLKYFVWGDREGLEVNIINDKLEIISSNPNLKYKTTLINSRSLEFLKNIGIDTSNEESIILKSNT